MPTRLRAYAQRKNQSGRSQSGSPILSQPGRASKIVILWDDCRILEEHPVPLILGVWSHRLHISLVTADSVIT